MLIKEIKGDFNNCVGFPGQVSCLLRCFAGSSSSLTAPSPQQAFFSWLAELTEEGTLCELD